jgi:hypothetical protein
LSKTIRDYRTSRNQLDKSNNEQRHVVQIKANQSLEKSSKMKCIENSSSDSDNENSSEIDGTNNERTTNNDTSIASSIISNSRFSKISLENKNVTPSKSNAKLNSSSSGDEEKPTFANKTKKKQLSRAISLYQRQDFESLQVAKIISNVEKFKNLDNSTLTNNILNKNNEMINKKSSFINIKEKSIYDYPLKRGNVKRSLSLKEDQERPFYLNTKSQLKSNCQENINEEKQSETNVHQNNKASNLSINFKKIAEKEDETTTNEQPSSSSLTNSDLDNSLNNIKTRFISKIYTKYECLPSKPLKTNNFLGVTSLSSNSSPVTTHFSNGKLMKSTASLMASSSPTSASISTSTSSISSASMSNRLTNEDSSSQSISSSRRSSTKVSMFMDNNNNNNHNMNKNDPCDSKCPQGLISNATSALNDLNLTGVTWSVPNIRRQFEAKNYTNNVKKTTTAISFSNKLVSDDKKAQFPITQPVLLTHNSSNIYHFFKDINGNPTTYI